MLPGANINRRRGLQIPKYFEILFRDAGVANEHVMFNLYHGALSFSQAKSWVKCL